jgi:hypothetical protein
VRKEKEDEPFVWAANVEYGWSGWGDEDSGEKKSEDLPGGGEDDPTSLADSYLVSHGSLWSSEGLTKVMTKMTKDESSR